MNRLPIDVISLDSTLALVKNNNTGMLIGAVATGDLWEDNHGNLRYRPNRRWRVLGWEHQRFSSLMKAVDALHRHVFNALDAQVDLRELQISESFLPIYKRAARKQKTAEARAVARRLKELKQESKLNYHDSLKHAGYSKFIY